MLSQANIPILLLPQAIKQQAHILDISHIPRLMTTTYRSTYDLCRGRFSTSIDNSIHSLRTTCGKESAKITLGIRDLLQNMENNPSCTFTIVESRGPDRAGSHDDWREGKDKKLRLSRVQLERNYDRNQYCSVATTVRARGGGPSRSNLFC